MEKPFLGGTIVFPSETDIFEIETAGSPCCSTGFDGEGRNSERLFPNSIVFGFTRTIIPEDSAKVFASSSKINLLSAPVFCDSMEKVFIPLEAPITLVFRVSPPRLFKALEKS